MGGEEWRVSWESIQLMIFIWFFPFNFFYFRILSKEGKSIHESSVSHRVVYALFGADAYAFVKVKFTFQGIFFLLSSPVRYQAVHRSRTFLFNFYLNSLSKVRFLHLYKIYSNRILISQAFQRFSLKCWVRRRHRVVITWAWDFGQWQLLPWFRSDTVFGAALRNNLGLKNNLLGESHKVQVLCWQWNRLLSQKWLVWNFHDWAVANLWLVISFFSIRQCCTFRHWVGFWIFWWGRRERFTWVWVWFTWVFGVIFFP